MPVVIIRGAHVEACANIYTRHATPRPIAHLLLSGANGRAMLRAFDPDAAGLFVFGHPTLGDWSSIPRLYKAPGGSPLHAFAGVTPDPATAQDMDFDGRGTIEVLVRGHVVRYANGVTRRPRAPFMALKLTGSTLLAAIKPSVIVWQTGDEWSDVPARYKGRGGVGLRIDVEQGAAPPPVRYAEQP